MPGRVRWTFVSWANSCVGTESWTTPHGRPAGRPDPTRPWYVRVLDSTGRTMQQMESRNHLFVTCPRQQALQAQHLMEPLFRQFVDFPDRETTRRTKLSKKQYTGSPMTIIYSTEWEPWVRLIILHVPLSRAWCIKRKGLLNVFLLNFCNKALLPHCKNLLRLDV